MNEMNKNWTGIRPSATRERYVDSFFNDTYRRLVGASNIDDGAISLPPVNVKESEENYELFVAAPGYEKDDFSIWLDNGILIVTAEKKAKTDESDDESNWMKMEYSYSSFHRSFQLPRSVDDQDIAASYENGILKIVVPRQINPEKNEAIKKVVIA